MLGGARGRSMRTVKLQWSYNGGGGDRSNRARRQRAFLGEEQQVAVDQDRRRRDCRPATRARRRARRRCGRRAFQGAGQMASTSKSRLRLEPLLRGQ